MAIKDEIEKPIVKVIYADGGTLEPTHCYFDVEINFKLVGGVLPCPPLKYISDRNDVLTAEIRKNQLLDSMLEKARKHKKIHQFIKEKQLTLDTFLTQEFP